MENRDFTIIFEKLEESKQSQDTAATREVTHFTNEADTDAIKKFSEICADIMPNPDNNFFYYTFS